MTLEKYCVNCGQAHGAWDKHRCRPNDARYKDALTDLVHDKFIRDDKAKKITISREEFDSIRKKIFNRQ